MKRFLSALIVLTLILGCGAAGYAETPYEVLEVCNCNEYVTLRSAPDTKSEGITRVYKGDCVYFDDYAANGFYQVSYGAETGFILAKYLRKIELESEAEPGGSDENPVGFDCLPGLPPYADFMSIGDLVCETVHDDYRVIARHVISVSEGREELLVVCYDSGNRPLWTTFEVNEVLTELDATSAFIAGTADSPCLVTFHAGRYFIARAIDGKGTLLWMNNCANQCTALETVLPGGGLITSVRDDGTIYATGYYNEAPVAIDVSGNFLWKGENPDPDNIYWPYKILPSDSGIQVLYDSCMDGDNSVYAVTYDPESGACIDFAAIETPER